MWYHLTIKGHMDVANIKEPAIRNKEATAHHIARKAIPCFFHATHAPMKDLQAYSSKCSPTPLNFPSRAIGLLDPITWGPSA